MTLQLKTKKKKKIKISGKADKIEINPELTEGVASIRNDILNKIGASRSRTKQWIRTPTGKIRIETFQDSPNRLFIRMFGEGMKTADAEKQFRQIRETIRIHAAKNKIPLIKAAPRIPDSVRGVEHIVLGAYNVSGQRMTMEVQKPTKA